MELGHWVTGLMGHLGHLLRTGRRVIILTRCETRDFPVFEKMPKMQNVHLKCWNDKSHCQVSVVGLKSLDVSPCNELLLLPMIIKNSLAWEYFFVTPQHISRHLELIIEQGHRINWVSESLDPRVTGSFGHKMWLSSMFGLYYARVSIIAVAIDITYAVGQDLLPWRRALLLRASSATIIQHQ